jgi:hypothetical protein
MSRRTSSDLSRFCDSAEASRSGGRPTAAPAATVSSTAGTGRMRDGEDLRRESFSGTGPGTPGKTPLDEPRTMPREVLPQVRQGRRGSYYSSEMDYIRSGRTADSDRDE